MLSIFYELVFGMERYVFHRRPSPRPAVKDTFLAVRVDDSTFMFTLLMPQCNNRVHLGSTHGRI
jgi:hypothetical protein